MKKSEMLFLASAVLGCGMEGEEDADEATETVHGALSSSFTTFTLPANPDATSQQFVHGPNKNDYACFLTRMSGPVTGDRSWANLIRSKGGDDWYLRSDGQTSATATCVKVNWFQSPGTARWQRSTGEGNLDHDDGSAWADGNFLAPDFDSANLWQANAASHITGVYGHLTHPLSSISIVEGATGSSWSRVSVVSNDDYVQAYTGSLFVGTPGTGLKAAYVGSPYQINHSGSSWQTTIMAKTSEAVCFFTKIGGRLAGPDDVLKINTKIVNGVEHWALEAKAGSGGDIRIQSRCMARNQPS